MINKFIIAFALVCIVVYITQWLFNHVNPFLGIGFLFISGVFLIKFIQKQIEQNEKK